MRDGKLLCWLTCLMVVATGCNVRVDKSEDGKNVKIATPFGAVAVNKNQTTAADVGLPPYPGASVETSSDGNESARVDVGFGSWKLRVRVAHYTTQDDRDQVLAFYKKAMAEYGAVIECEGKHPVGTPVRTSEGLTCEDDAGKHSGSFSKAESGETELKAGSERHQHLVVIKGKKAPTEFTLVALDLPHPNNEDHGTN